MQTHYVSAMCHTEPVKRASVSPKPNALDPVGRYTRIYDTRYDTGGCVTPAPRSVGSVSPKLILAQSTTKQTNIKQPHEKKFEKKRKNIKKVLDKIYEIWHAF